MSVSSTLAFDCPTLNDMADNFMPVLANGDGTALAAAWCLVRFRPARSDQVAPAINPQPPYLRSHVVAAQLQRLSGAYMH